MITTFSHPKGGVGKTLLCFNYSVYLLLNNYEPIVIDLDGQHSISNINNIRNAYNLQPLNILTFNDVNKLASFLNTTDKNQNVIIDTGGFDSAFNRVALAFANRIITPVSDSPVEIMRLLDFDRILNEISNNLSHDLKTYVVLNRIHSSLKNTDFIKQPFIENKHYVFLNSIIRDRARIKFSVANGKSVFEEDGSLKDEKAVNELTDLFQEINQL